MFYMVMETRLVYLFLSALLLRLFSLHCLSSSTFVPPSLDQCALGGVTLCVCVYRYRYVWVEAYDHQSVTVHI